MRSLLFVPGDDERKLGKALTSGADAIIIDLEDSVASARKAEARTISRAFIAEVKQTDTRPKLILRVNPLGGGETDADLDGVMPAGPDMIMLPKSRTGSDITLLSAKLAVREAESNLVDGITGVVAIATETAQSVFGLGTYAGATHRLRGLTWGGEDLSADLGAEANRLPHGAYTSPYMLVRNLCLLGAVAAEVQPIDSVFTNFRDMDGLREEALASRRDGFTGKMAIHPAQVPVINAVFTPSEKMIQRARKIIEVFEANPDLGVIGIDGEMIDKPHVKRAERLLAAAKAAGLAV
jgi:citrate lyase subunit beta / citryl-CoA lyase